MNVGSVCLCILAALLAGCAQTSPSKTVHGATAAPTFHELISKATPVYYGLDADIPLDETRAIAILPLKNVSALGLWADLQPMVADGDSLDVAVNADLLVLRGESAHLNRLVEIVARLDAQKLANTSSHFCLFLMPEGMSVPTSWNRDNAPKLRVAIEDQWRMFKFYRSLPPDVLPIGSGEKGKPVNLANENLGIRVYRGGKLPPLLSTTSRELATDATRNIELQDDDMIVVWDDATSAAAESKALATAISELEERQSNLQKQRQDTKELLDWHIQLGGNDTGRAEIQGHIDKLVQAVAKYDTWIALFRQEYAAASQPSK